MCVKKLSANIVYDNCTPALRSKAGLETKAVLINRADIDLTSTTTSGATITSLQLVSGATGYSINWIKQHGTSSTEFTTSDSGSDTFNHKFAGRIQSTSALDAERIEELKTSELVVVVETRWKGTGNLQAYKVFGFDNGLRMSTGTWVSTDNDGAFIFELASVEGFGEYYPWMVYNTGTLATNKTKFNALFA